MSRSFFVAIELSRSTWVVAIQPPAVDKVSLFRNAGGEIERLFELFEQARRRAGQPIEICACYEAGYDGFWIYRAPTARGVACAVLDSAGIQVSRRARRVKTDTPMRKACAPWPHRQAHRGEWPILFHG
jgi:transposase